MKRLWEWIKGHWPVTMKTHVDTINAYTERMIEINVMHQREIVEVSKTAYDLVKRMSRVNISNIKKDGEYGISIRLDARLFQYRNDEDQKRLIADIAERMIKAEILHSKFVQLPGGAK